MITCRLIFEIVKAPLSFLLSLLIA